MYPKKVKSLILDNTTTSLSFSNLLTDRESHLVEDYALPIQDSSDMFNPDFAIRGIYHKISKGLEHKFTICKEGPHILYITGMPKAKRIPEFEENFKLIKTIFQSYWEDRYIGYLFQIIDIETNIN